MLIHNTNDIMLLGNDDHDVVNKLDALVSHMKVRR